MHINETLKEGSNKMTIRIDKNTTNIVKISKEIYIFRIFVSLFITAYVGHKLWLNIK